MVLISLVFTKSSSNWQNFLDSECSFSVLYISEDHLETHSREIAPFWWFMGIMLEKHEIPSQACLAGVKLTYEEYSTVDENSCSLVALTCNDVMS